MKKIIMLTGLFIVSAPAAANDSEAAFALGGLTLRQSEAITMDSEDLYISRDEVRVTYRFTNRSARDVTTLVSFPLPPQPDFANSDYEDGYSRDFSGLEFSTKVNGQPVVLSRHVAASVDGRDVTARLVALGWPVDWASAGYEEGKWPLRWNRLPAAELAGYLAEGLLVRSDGSDLGYRPNWQATTHITREQSFPAGRTITVEHRYSPITGGSVAGSLYPAVRSEYSDILTNYRSRYCTDDAFLRGFDAREARNARSGRSFAYSESWISYVLSSGANWRGPIADFRLVVDKGRADSLVSFCMDGVRKISPTQFEVRKRNFEPSRDLEILIIDWHDTGN